MDQSINSADFDRVADEFTDQLRRGERPSIEEYALRYPELETEIRNAFPIVQMMEEIGPTTNSSDAQPHDFAQEANGRHVGDFRLIRELGRGGMGVVYEAEQLQLGRTVALKVLPSSLSRDKQAVQRFRREARAAARLTHPNIVPIYDVQSDDDVLFYTMQLIRGYSLDTLIRELHELATPDDHTSRVTPAAEVATSLCRETSESPTDPAVPNVESIPHYGRSASDVADTNPISPPISSSPSRFDQNSRAADSSKVLSESGSPGTITYFRNMSKLALQVADALSYAHKNGIVHRDVKPGNLLVDPLSRIWVTDFGLAKLDESDLTKDGEILGTLRYMAPEQLRGWADPRSDVYSLGMTLYELLVLQPALDATDKFQLMRDIVGKEPVKPRSIDRRIPIDLETIVLKSISKEPGDRYQSCESLRDDLKNFVEFRPIHARQATPLDYITRWASRNRLMATLLMAVLFLLVGWSTTATLMVSQLKEGGKQLYGPTVSGIADAIAQDNIAAAAEDIEKLQALNKTHWEFEMLKKLQSTPHDCLKDPEFPVMSTTYCRTGKWFAAIGYTANVYVWDANTLQLLRKLSLGDSIRDGVRIRASPDGRHLACVISNETQAPDIHLLDVYSNDEPILLRAAGGFHQFSFSWPAGKYLLAAAPQRDKPPKVHAYNVAAMLEGTSTKPTTLEIPFAVNKDTLFEFDDNGLLTAYLSTPEEQYVATWNPLSQEAINRYDVRVNVRRGDEFHVSDDNYIVVTSESDTRTGPFSRIVVYDKYSHRELWNIIGDAYRTVTLSPDGRFIACSSTNSQVVLYDIDAQQQIKLRGHENGVHGGLHFSHDSTKLLTGSWDNTVRVWDVTLQPDYFDAAAGSDLVLSPDAQRLITNDRREISVWDATTLQLIRKLPGHAPNIPPRGMENPAMLMAISQDGRLLATSARQFEIMIWDLADGSIQQVIRRPDTDNCDALAFHPDTTNPTIIATFADGACEAYDLQSKTWRQISRDNGETLWALNVSPNGKWVSSGGTQIIPRVVPFDPADTSNPLDFESQKTTIFHIDFTSDSSMMAVSGKSRTLAICDLDNAPQNIISGGYSGNVHGLDYTSDDERLMVLTSKMLRVIDPSTNRQLLRLPIRDGNLHRVAAGPGGKTGTVYTTGDRIRLWEPKQVVDTIYNLRRKNRHAQIIVERLRAHGPKLNEEVTRLIQQDRSLDEDAKRAAIEHLQASGEDIPSLFYAAWNFAFHRKQAAKVRLASDEASTDGTTGDGTTGEEASIDAAPFVQFMEVVNDQLVEPSPQALNLLGIVQYYSGDFDASYRSLLAARPKFVKAEGHSRFRSRHYSRSDNQRDRALNGLFLAMTMHQLGLNEASSQLAEATKVAIEHDVGRMKSWRMVDVVTSVRRDAELLILGKTEIPNPDGDQAGEQ